MRSGEAELRSESARTNPRTPPRTHAPDHCPDGMPATGTETAHNPAARRTRTARPSRADHLPANWLAEAGRRNPATSTNCLPDQDAGRNATDASDPERKAEKATGRG